MREYREEELLQLSGLQHFAFCRRQWALIHIEQKWQENLRTMEGRLLHETAHGNTAEKRGDTLIVRGLPVVSYTLGINGVCDVVEFYQSDGGVSLFGRRGLWQPAPVEYKRGRPKEEDADLLQLCAQAMCLEEMLACQIQSAFLYYGETKRRLEVLLDSVLRGKVMDLLEEMHSLYRRRYTPQVTPGKHCKACSLVDLCLPELNRIPHVSDYLKRFLQEEP